MMSAPIAPEPEKPTAANLRRPLLRWHGGKWRIAPWIIAHLPQHRTYVEPFGGAASVLLRKPRSYCEVYNDLDGGVVALFRLLRSDRAGELVRAVERTPFARDEFELAWLVSDDPVEQARRLIVRSFMSHPTDGCTRARRTGFRCAGDRCGTHPAGQWAGYPRVLVAVAQRLQGVVIEHRDAMAVCRRYDAPRTLHYLDPPYLPETRSLLGHGEYRHEMTAGDHAALLDAALQLRGAVVISGYPSRLYDDALAGWRREQRASLADRALPRTEVLWISPRTAAGLGGQLWLEEAA